jgi:DNA polymerase-1
LKNPRKPSENEAATLFPAPERAGDPAEGRDAGQADDPKKSARPGVDPGASTPAAAPKALRVAPASSPASAPADTVFLVDGTALVYRAHFAFLRNPLITTKGELVSAVYGFASALFQLLRVEKPSYMAVAFDRSAPTFRHEQYAEYKAHRRPVPDDLIPQLPRARELVSALGVCILEQDGVEADDLIGTMVRVARQEGRDVVIVSSDKDFMQLLEPGVRQWIPPYMGGDAQWVDPDGVRERWGVRPDQMVDLLALMGDASDNVPGVAGVGAKTAASLLQEYASLDGSYAHLGEIGKKGLQEKLERDRASAYMSRDLVCIRAELPPPARLEDLRVPPLAEQTALPPLLRELEFRRLLEVLGLAEEETWSAHCAILDTEEALVAALREWRAEPRPLVIDAVTASPDARTGAAVGISLAWEEGRAYYIPVGHQEGRNLAPEIVGRHLRPILGDPSVGLIGQNLKSDLHVLAGLGLEARGELLDTLLASYLIDPEGAHDLDALSRSLLQHRMIPIADLIGKGRKQIALDQVPVEKVAEFSGEDVDVTFRLFHILTPRLQSQGLYKLWEELECPLVRVLLRMEQAGVKVDANWLRGLSGVMEKDLERVTAEIYRLAGVEFNIGSPVQLSKVLFETLKLPSRKKTKTGRSTDSEVLEELAEFHPLPRLLLEHRSLSKLKGTYIDALPLLIDPRTGRIHACFNQMVAATGRLSSSDPNLQNIPIRTPLGREIRKAFVAEPGSVLLSADYSQIELRLLAHLSGDEWLKAAFRSGQDVHAATAERIFGVTAAQVDPAMRARAKTVNFGVIYGMGPLRLARELSITIPQARAFIESYFAKMPAVKGYMDDTLDQARRDGYVSTLFGRRRLIRGLESGDSRIRSQAERIVNNTPIQGAAADLIKRAMLEVDRTLAGRGLKARLILQIHDELVLEVPEEEIGEVERLVRAAMEGAAALDVPLQVDIGRGAHWGEAHR